MIKYNQWEYATSLFLFSKFCKGLKLIVMYWRHELKHYLGFFFYWNDIKIHRTKKWNHVTKVSLILIQFKTWGSIPGRGLKSHFGFIQDVLFMVQTHWCLRRSYRTDILAGGENLRLLRKFVAKFECYTLLSFY